MKRLILFLSHCSVAFLIIVLCVYCSTRKTLSSAELQACKQVGQETKQILANLNTSVNDVKTFETTVPTLVHTQNPTYTVLGLRDQMLEEYDFYKNTYTTEISKSIFNYGTCNTQLYDVLAPVAAQSSQFNACNVAFFELYNNLPTWIINAFIATSSPHVTSGYVLVNMAAYSISIYSNPNYTGTPAGVYTIPYTVPIICQSLKIQFQNNFNWFTANY